jgi:hypothetical protein
MEIPVTKEKLAVIQKEVNQDVVVMRVQYVAVTEYIVALKIQLVT